MKIAIDVSQIVYGTGVSQYTINLVKSLLKIDKDNEYILFAGTLRRKKDILNIFPQIKVFPISPLLEDIVWNRLHVLPIEKLIGKVDVLHTSDWTEPPSSAFKVTTVHDLYSLKFPRLVDPVVRETHKKKLALVFKESKRVIVPSNTTKNDLVEYGMDENIIRVIPEAPNLVKANQSQIDTIKQKYGIKGDYVISIGVTKLKNTERIIKAFDLARHGQDIKLLLVGRPVGVTLEEIRNVRNLGFVDASDLSPLLTGSRVLVFPSIYEGFGVPILEGFSCEVPVVTSNVGSMKEVAGDAAVLVDPYDVNSIADGITKALKEPKGLIEKGLIRVKQFSWEETARKTLEVYNEAKTIQ